jgi:hypothetical protein
MNASRSKHRFILRCCIGIFILYSVHHAESAEKFNFATHPFFKLLIGGWESEGKLVGTDGKEVLIKEEWKGIATQEGGFVIEGNRLLNQDKQAFLWTFSFNASTGLFEALHEIKTGSGETQRFEASVSEVSLTMELRLTGEGHSSIVVKDSFSDAERKTLMSEVTLTDFSGVPYLSGTVKHTRVKFP